MRIEQTHDYWGGNVWVDKRVRLMRDPAYHKGADDRAIKMADTKMLSEEILAFAKLREQRAISKSE